MSTETKQAKDIFAVYQQNIDRYLDAVKRSVPKYHQSITNAQQECVGAYENVINSTITLQREYAKRAGITTSVPEATLKVIRDTTEEAIKTASINNQIALATIDAAQQNVRAFNDNVKAFAESKQKHHAVVDFGIYRNQSIVIFF